MNKEEIKRKRLILALVCLFSILVAGIILLVVILTSGTLNKYQRAFFFCIIVFAMGIGLAVVGNAVRRVGVEEPKEEQK